MGYYPELFGGPSVITIQNWKREAGDEVTDHRWLWGRNTSPKAKECGQLSSKAERQRNNPLYSL